jgi:polysaccharide biosynthesis protein
LLADYSTELRWSYIGSVTLGVLQVVSTSIMARLLTPADFGIMAVVLLLSRAMGYFAQLGVGRALVQKETLSEEEIRGGGAANSRIIVCSPTVAGEYERCFAGSSSIQLGGEGVRRLGTSVRG